MARGARHRLAAAVAVILVVTRNRTIRFDPPPPGSYSGPAGTARCGSDGNRNKTSR